MQAVKRIVSVTRHEWVLPSEAHYTEVNKAVGAALSAQEQIRKVGARCSDITVTGDEEELIVRFTEEHKD